jgi:hypothetical protein
MSTLNEDARLCRPSDMLDICKSLVIYDEKTSQVGLAHSSVKAVLTTQDASNPRLNSFAVDYKLAQSLLAERCLTYLCFSDFRTGPRNCRAELNCWPLLNYASFFWATHVRNVDLFDPSNTYLCELIDKFFETSNESRGGCFTTWVQHLIPSASVETVLRATPLYYASSFGLTQVLKRNLEKSWMWQLEIPSGRRLSTPIQVAAYRGRTECVRLLLDAGADPNAKNCHGDTAIDWAFMGRYYDIVSLLQEHKAIPGLRLYRDDSEESFLAG